MLARSWEDSGERLVPIEVKTSATASSRMAAGVARLRQDLGALVAPGYVVYLGDRQLPLGARMTALPLGDL